MLSYEINDSILTLRASGTTTLNQRKPVFDAIRADPLVPYGALVLLDVLNVDRMAEHVAAERLRVLLDQLGQKLGTACAVIVHDGIYEQARAFQDAGAGAGLKVQLFSHEQAARQWLDSCRVAQNPPPELIA